MEIELRVNIDEENDDVEEATKTVAMIAAFIQHVSPASETMIRTPDGQLVPLGGPRITN